jgi:hypothetical protein
VDWLGQSWTSSVSLQLAEHGQNQSELKLSGLSASEQVPVAAVEWVLVGQLGTQVAEVVAMRVLLEHLAVLEGTVQQEGLLLSLMELLA